jgi:hypothetical protein
MDGIIQHYLEIRLKLVNLIENRSVGNNETIKQEVPNSPPVRPARNNQCCKSYKTPETIQWKKNYHMATNLPIDIATKCDTPSSSINRTPKAQRNIAKIFNTPKKKSVSISSTDNAKSVSCPVCSVEISESHINVHLDACLKREMSEGIMKNKE